MLSVYIDRSCVDPSIILLVLILMSCGNAHVYAIWNYSEILLDYHGTMIYLCQTKLLQLLYTEY